MPWGYLIIIAILIAFVIYNIDLSMKMASDIKYIRLNINNKK